MIAAGLIKTANSNIADCSALPKKSAPLGCVIPIAIIGAATMASTTAITQLITPEKNNKKGKKGIYM